MTHRRQPAEQGDAPAPVGHEELSRAIEILARVAEDRGALALVDAAARERLQRIAGEIARPDARQRRQLRKALARGERQTRKARDGALRKETGIRKLRNAPVFQTPLPELPRPGTDATGWWPGALPAPAPTPTSTSDELHEPRKCYVCKAEYRRLHPFYDQLCPACGDENEAHRTAAVDLSLIHI